MTARQLYVLGFAFTHDGRVALIRKKRPQWQEGRLNGIGGKVEDNESSIEAMQREFLEETGLDIKSHYWQYRGRMYGYDWSVFVYTVQIQAVENVSTQTDEEVVLVDLDNTDVLHMETIENVEALIHLCRIPVEMPSNVFPRFELNYTVHTHG